MLEEIISEARSVVAAGGDPDWKSLRDRVRALRLGPDAQRDALKQLERIGAVQRARSSVKPAAPVSSARPVPPSKRLLQTKPTITGNMDVRRGDGHTLVWNREPSVTVWEARLSERPDPRGDYVVRETAELPGESTAYALPLSEAPLRVHLLGRDRGGRLVRRLILSGITRETWSDRWQRRATAS
jgi:hypothetical protein